MLSSVQRTRNAELRERVTILERRMLRAVLALDMLLACILHLLAKVHGLLP